MKTLELLIPLTLLCIIGEGGCFATISCFVCSSRNGSHIDCEDPFNAGVATYVDRCKVPRRGHIGEFPAHFCIKMIGTSSSTHEKVVIRRCTTETMDTQCGKFKFQDELFHGCILTCNLDGCNSSSIIQSSKFLLFLTVPIVLLVYISTYNKVSPLLS